MPKTLSLANSATPIDNVNDNETLHPLFQLLYSTWKFITHCCKLLLATLPTLSAAELAGELITPEINESFLTTIYNFLVSFLKSITLVVQGDIEKVIDFCLQTFVKWPLRILDNLRDNTHLVRYWMGYEDTFPTLQASKSGTDDAWRFAVQCTYILVFSIISIYYHRHLTFMDSLRGIEKETLALLTQNFPGTSKITIKSGVKVHQCLIQFAEQDADFFQFLVSELELLTTPKGLHIFSSIEIINNNTFDIRFTPKALSSIPRFSFIPILYSFFYFYLGYLPRRVLSLTNYPLPQYIRSGIDCIYAGFLCSSGWAACRGEHIPLFITFLYTNPRSYAKAANLRLLEKLHSYNIQREMNFLASLAPKVNKAGYLQIMQDLDKGEIQLDANLTSRVQNPEQKREISPVSPGKQAFCYFINISPNLFDSFKIWGKEDFLLHPKDFKFYLAEYLNFISKEYQYSFSVFSDPLEPLLIQIVFHSVPLIRLSQTFEQWMLKPKSTLPKLKLPASELASLRTLIEILQEHLKNKGLSEVTVPIITTTVNFRGEQLPLESADVFREAVISQHEKKPISLEDWKKLIVKVQETLNQLKEEKDGIHRQIEALQTAHPQVVVPAKALAISERIKSKKKKAEPHKAEPLQKAAHLSGQSFIQEFEVGKNQEEPPQARTTSLEISSSSLTATGLFATKRQQILETEEKYPTASNSNSASVIPLFSTQVQTPLLTAASDNCDLLIAPNILPINPHEKILWFYGTCYQLMRAIHALSAMPYEYRVVCAFPPAQGLILRNNIIHFLMTFDFDADLTNLHATLLTLKPALSKVIDALKANTPLSQIEHQIKLANFIFLNNLLLLDTTQIVSVEKRYEAIERCLSNLAIASVHAQETEVHLSQRGDLLSAMKMFIAGMGEQIKNLPSSERKRIHDHIKLNFNDLWDPVNHTTYFETFRNIIGHEYGKNADTVPAVFDEVSTKDIETITHRAAAVLASLKENLLLIAEGVAQPLQRLSM